MSKLTLGHRSYGQPLLRGDISDVIIGKYCSIAHSMIKVTYEETLFDYVDAIINNEFEGFKEDYLVLHSLLRKHRPDSYFEIGTNCGTGLNVACNAIYQYYFEAKIYSLDLPTELAHISLQHPISEGKGDAVGHRCKFPYTQLRGDSTKFDFSKYPCQAWFIDGEHTEYNVNVESHQIMALNSTKLVIWHDADMEPVWTGITKAMKVSKDFELYRVEGTRIAYALRK